MTANPVNGASAGAAHMATMMVALRQLRRSPHNPRKTFDAESLLELADSIQANGLLQNLVVRPLIVDRRHDRDVNWADIDGDLYEVVAGERRFRALLMLEDQGNTNEP